MKFLLQLGRLPTLSVYESQQLFTSLGTVTKFDDQYLVVETAQQQQFLRLLEQSSGIIKALEVISIVEPPMLVSAITEELERAHTTNFSAYFHSATKQKTLFQDVKNSLKEKGISSRYLEGTAEGLSAAVLLHKKVMEFGVFGQSSEIWLAKTIWSQNIDHWTQKDIEKPHRNPDKGMLPPKLARMMINFLSPQLREKGSVRVLDPFCGTGTVLIETVELGFQAIGSDLSQDAVIHAGENLRWFSEKFNTTQEYSLSTLDATQISPQHIGGKVDAIVTEPFLGKQQPKPDQLPGMFKGLEKQYLGIFKRWTHILNPGGEVVIVTPLVELGKQQYDLSKIIDKSREFGYSILSGPLVYSRGHTIVKRAIYHLKLIN